MPKVSIVIPTLGRSASLKECLDSIYAQAFQDFEVIQVTEEGELARLRNRGARQASGEYVVFIDDDVVCSPQWLASIVATFESRAVDGVSGPAIVPKAFRKQRDFFRFPLARGIYDLLFLDGKAHLPGHITTAGAWTPGACDVRCQYEGPVQFLEACNMAFRRRIFNKFGGFDEKYRGIGDWSEPDLALRFGRAGYKLWFTRNAVVEHRCSQAGPYKKRRGKCSRMENYERFSEEWITPNWRHSLYKRFLRTYYWMKERGCLN